MVIGVVLVRSYDHCFAVHSHGDSELVVGRGVGSSELGGLGGVGPATALGLGEDVTRTFVVVLVIGVVLVRSHDDGVAVDRHGNAELVVRGGVGSVSLAFCSQLLLLEFQVKT